MCQVFQEKNTLGDSQFPFNLAREGAVDYEMENYPMTRQGPARCAGPAVE